MNVSFSRAIKVPFSDENWPIKLLIAFLLYVPSVLAIISLGPENPAGPILSFAGTIFIAGYSFIIMHNEINNKEPVLPEWDFLKSLIIWVQGFIISLGFGLISLPIVIILFVTASFVPILAIPAILLGILFILCYGFIVVPTAQGLFAKSFQLADAFNFKAIYKIFKFGWLSYLTAGFYGIVISLIYFIPVFIISIGMEIFMKNSSSIAMIIIQVIPVFVIMNLYGQAYKTALAKSSTPIDL